MVFAGFSRYLQSDDPVFKPGKFVFVDNKMIRILPQKRLKADIEKERERCLHFFCNDCQKYVPIDLASYSKVIASEAKQSDAKHRPEQSREVPRCARDEPRWRIRSLRRQVPTRLPSAMSPSVMSSGSNDSGRMEPFGRELHSA
jgi:hypothetical protein